MPDRMAVHLPSFLTNAAVHLRMKEELEGSGRHVISQSHFYNLWSSEFPHVSIPKVCSICYSSIVVCLSDNYCTGEQVHKM